MSKKSKRDLAKVDALLSSFQNIEKNYPEGGYGNHTRKLIKERIELANKIGRRPK
jgi:hypothetical protein